MSNRNTLWANIFVDELARAGLKAVCIAPGSRSTPLTIAFARHGSIKIYTHLDERSAGFFALGLALASDEPVALLCTSGTAAANFFPAIVEAHMSRVPLIVITADRPPELRHSGANQTIDQVKVYGDYALWSVDVGLPEANPPAIAIRNLRTLAARAYARANGIRKGVVHLNMPFRKPLEPVDVEGDAVEVPVGAEARDNNYSFTEYKQGLFRAVIWRERHLLRLGDLIDRNPKGLMICGPNSPRKLRKVGGEVPQIHDDDLRPVGFSQILDGFAGACGYPVIADATSGLRFTADRLASTVWFTSYDSLPPQIGNVIDPDIILRFGDVPTSAWLNHFLQTTNAKHHIHVRSDSEWSDDNHNITQYVHADEYDVAMLIEEVLAERRDGVSEWKTVFNNFETLIWKTIDQEIIAGDYFDGAAVYDVVDLIPAGSTLFVGNSLPVRLLDQFGKPQNKRIYVYANRGASGIDGNISTALGAGAARPDQPLVAIVGDITFYHDMNGLLAVQRNGVPVTIVLLNNNGGGIFHRLPIKNFEPEFTDLFVMPHGLEFEHAAKMYGLDYVRADNRESFRQAFSESVNNRLSRIIEVRTDAQHDLQRRQEIMDAVQARIKELNL